MHLTCSVATSGRRTRARHHAGISSQLRNPALLDQGPAQAPAVRRVSSLRCGPGRQRLASAATSVSLVSDGRGLALYFRDLGWRRLVFGTVGGFVCWAAWMGWDIYYDIDLAGVASGPYHPRQVVGSALSLLVVVLVTGFSSRPMVALPTYALITAGYTTGFCVSAIIISAVLRRRWCEPLAARGDHSVHRRRYGNLHRRRAGQSAARGYPSSCRAFATRRLAAWPEGPTG